MPDRRAPAPALYHLTLRLGGPTPHGKYCIGGKLKGSPREEDIRWFAFLVTHGEKWCRTPSPALSEEGCSSRSAPGSLSLHFRRAGDGNLLAFRTSAPLFGGGGPFRVQQPRGQRRGQGVRGRSGSPGIPTLRIQPACRLGGSLGWGTRAVPLGVHVRPSLVTWLTHIVSLERPPPHTPAKAPATRQALPAASLLPLRSSVTLRPQA